MSELREGSVTVPAEAEAFHAESLNPPTQATIPFVPGGAGSVYRPLIRPACWKVESDL